MARCDNCLEKSRTIKKVKSSLLANGQARMCKKCRDDFADFKEEYERQERILAERFVGIDPRCERKY